MSLNESELLSYYDRLNNELQHINNVMKNEKDEKKVSNLIKISDLINSVLIKINQIKMLNEKLK